MRIFKHVWNVFRYNQTLQLKFEHIKMVSIMDEQRLSSAFKSIEA